MAFGAMKALMDMTLGVAACSVSESQCNGGKCTPVRVVVGRACSD